ncbi:MAG: DUF4340 domain-containing protein [Nevskiales bacterium]|nr:DUF4340 domain-containing protein [Nevskiales bacterium]
MKRGLLNLILLGVAAVLGLAVFLSQEKKESGPPLTALTPDTVTQIEIQHPGANIVRLEKKDKHWRLVTPRAALADDFEISALLGLTDQESEALDTASLTLSELGLDPPSFSVRLNDTDIAFGGVEPLQYRRYVKVGETVSLIEDPSGTTLDSDYADLVAKQLLPEGSEIQRLELPGLTLAKNAAGTWSSKPAHPKASGDTLQKLVDGWKTARSSWNETGKDARTKGEAVTVKLGDGTALRFVIVEKDPQLKLHRPDLGVTFVLSKTQADGLLNLPEAEKEETKLEAAGPTVESATSKK